MLLPRAMIVWVMAATTLPVVTAYAAEATPAAPSPATENSPPSPAPDQVPPVPMEGLQFDVRPAGLAYKVDVPDAAPRPDDYRFDFAQRPAPGATLRLSPVVSAPRTGWAYSGRLGPLRWLAPIDGEGETKLRLFGRVQGQPRTPGMGNFNFSLHYTFE
jgi:hypothetical protein